MTRYRPLGGPVKVIYDWTVLSASNGAKMEASVQCGFCDAVEGVKELTTGASGFVENVRFNTLLPPCAHWEIIIPEVITWTF